MNEDILAQLAPHQVDALKRGGSTLFDGKAYTAEDFGITPGINADKAFDAALDSTSKDAIIADLKTQVVNLSKGKNGDLQKQITDLATERDGLSAKIARVQAYAESLPDDQKAAFFEGVKAPETA